MAKKSITIGGMPGAGTTTIAKMLAEKTGMSYINAGEIYRDIADRKGMSLLDFERYSEAHPEIDLEIDKRQEEIIRRGNVVVEGRLSGWIAYLKNIPAIKIWLECDENERIRRIVERENGEFAEKKKETKEREESEVRRYKKFYGIDLNDKSIYDIVIDTTSIPPEEVLKRIIEKIKI